MRRTRRAVMSIVAVVVTALAVVAVGQIPASADSPVEISITNTAVVKPTSGSASMTFPVRLLRRSNNTVRVSWYTQDGSAISGRDYTASSGSLTFQPGITLLNVTVPVLANTLDTGNRYFYVDLNNAQYGGIADGQATGTIESNSPQPYISVNDTAAVVGYAGTGNATFTVALSAPSVNTVTVRYSTGDGNAVAGRQYTAEAGTASFAPGVTTQTVTVPLLGTVPPEAQWYFALYLSAPTNAAINDNTAYAYITDNDRSAYLTTDDVIVVKPATGTQVVNVPVRLSTPATFPVTADYYTSDNSATASGGDYVGTTGTITIPAGSTSTTVPVTINGGAANNPLRYFGLNLDDQSGGVSLQRGTSYVGIESSGSMSTQLSVRNTAVVKPTSGSATASFVVTAQPASATPITFTYGTGDGNAVAGTDYTAASGSATIAANATSTTITVPVAGNTSVQGDLYFYLQISAPSSGAVFTGTGYAEILPSSPGQQRPFLSVDYAAGVAPATGTAVVQVPVTLAPASPNTVTVNYGTSDSSAVAGTDYTATSGSLTFSPGTTVKYIPVTLLTNSAPGSDKQFQVSISAATNASIDTNYVSVTIRNQNVPPILSLDNSAAFRPVSGISVLQFRAVLSAPSVNAVTFKYSTQDGSAVAGTDYTSTSGTATIPAGSTVVFLQVTVTATTLARSQLVMYLNINTVTGAAVTDTQATGYIDNNSVVPYLSVVDTTTTVGASATTAKFTVALSSATPNPVTVNYSTQDGSAIAGRDYTTTSGTLSFPAGTLTQTVSVPVAANAVSSGTSNFYLNIGSPVNAQISRSQASGTLAYTAVPSYLSVADVVVSRQSSGTQNATVTVSLTPASAGTVTVNYSTQDGSAVNGVDYTQTSGSLSFAPGDTSKTFTVPILPNNASTPDRTFYVNLGSPVNAGLQRSQGYVEIVDTVAPTSGTSYLSVNDSTVVAATSGTATESFTVSLRPAASTPVSVSYYTSNNDGVSGVNYTGVQGTLTFAPGQTSKTVTVAVAPSSVRRNNVSFYLNLRQVSGPATYLRSSSYGYILYPTPGSNLASGPDVSVVRGTTGSSTLTFTVNLTPSQAGTAQVDYRTEDGSAIAGRDYNPVSGTLSFAPGVTSQTVAVTVYGTPTATGNESFDLLLENPRNAAMPFGNDARAYGYLDAADTFTLTGKITDPSGAPLSGVTVTRTGNYQPALSVTTAADGTYAIPNTVSGSAYTVTPSGSGLTYYPSRKSAAAIGGTATVQFGGTFVGYTGTVIAGRVYDPTLSKAVAGATVTRTGAAQPTATATTTAGGEYVIPTSTNGTYTVNATATGYATSLPPNLSVAISGASNTGAFLAMVAAPYIAPYVTTSANAPVSGVTITVSGPTSRTTATSLFGYYPLSGLPSGTYLVTPSLSGHTFTPASRSVNITSTAGAIPAFTEN